MVKRTSFLASNEKFRVRFLVELLDRHLSIVVRHLFGSWLFDSSILFYGVRGVAAAACQAVNQEVRVRLPSDTPLNYTSVLLGEPAASKTA